MRDIMKCPPYCCMTGFFRESSMVPDWLFANIMVKLSNYTGFIKKEDFNLMEINMKNLNRTVLVVFINIQMKDGIFLVYEKIAGKYKQIYEKKGPVIGIQTFWDINLVFTMRLGSGTGYWIDQLYVLRFTDNGCKEAFSDYAQFVKVLPEIEPGTQIIGSIAFDTPDHMVYNKTSMTVQANGSIKPDSIKCTPKLISYNYALESFV